MQTVTVVPVLRLRRATTGWSYKVPAGVKLQPGALVIVPFRHHPTLGIVWNTEENSKATEQVTEILTATPLVRSGQRRLIEWLAEEGLCSLSTALYVWLPASLRGLPLTKPVRESLSKWDTEQPSAKHLAEAKQHAVLVPNHREEAEVSLAAKYGTKFRSTFADTTPAQEFTTWLAIAKGECTVTTGRERALYAPWANLRHLTVIEPEDISYHTGQSPYVSLVDGAKVLADATQAALTHRTNVPLAAARRIWPTAAGLPTALPPVELTDLRHARIINEGLVNRVKLALSEHKHVILLYNAHDRPVQREDGSRQIVPGIETVGKQLAAALGTPTLPSLVHLGTRNILATLPRPVGLAGIVSIDPLLSSASFLDRLHGWGDIGRLIQSGAPLIIQTWHPEHELVQSLVNGTFEAYCSRETADAARIGLPPFSEEIVCALPLEKSGLPTPAALASQLQENTPTPWQVSHPRPAQRRGKPITIVTLHAPQGTRVPSTLRTILAALPSPWKVERGPWYAV